MKYIIQFEIILAISLVGELLNRIIPLPIPASIYGMVILTAIIVISLLSTVLVILASGHATQIIINLKKKEKKQ